MNQTNQRTIKSPNRNVSKNELLIIAEAETLVKEEITYGVSHGLSKEEIYAKCSKIIAKYISLLPEERKSVCRKSLLQMLIRDYTLFSMNAKTIMRNAQDAILGYTIKSVNDLFAKKEDIITRGFKTDRKHGLAIIYKYQKQLRNEIKLLSATQAEVSEIINSKPNKMTLRNKAEMTIRYEANLEDIKRFQEKNIDLVWTSSHVDCSKRCEPYQGKLWSISGKNAGKTIDGNKVGNLNEALQGSKKDGNGIINGYNCRHYLIEYTKGSKPPIDYDRASIKKEREINNKQRLYERNIRQLKLQERLARKQGDKDVAKKINEKWKLLEKKYKSFSLKNGRAFYEWRTRIMRNETLQSNKWGENETQKIRTEIINQNKVNEYESKYIKIYGTEVKADFKSEKEARDYIASKGLYFKGLEDDSSNEMLDSINKKIQGALNLERNYKPTEVSSELIPNEVKDKLISDVVVLSKPNRNKGKEGTACHVANKHLEGCEIDFLKDTMTTISNPTDYFKEFTSTNNGNPRVIVHKKIDSKHKRVIIIDFLKLKDGYVIEFVHNYMRKINKKDREIFDKIEKYDI